MLLEERIVGEEEATRHEPAATPSTSVPEE
jgi:hypothetical protein